MDDNYELDELLTKPKRKNSRTKGNAFERQIAKALNNRFKTTEFSRSPGSGAFATTHSLPEHLKIYGDLITPDKFKYCIECKKGYNHLNLYSLYNYFANHKMGKERGRELFKEVLMLEAQYNARHDSYMKQIKYHARKFNVVELFKAHDWETPEPIRHINIHRNKTYKVYLFDELLKCWDSLWFD